MIRLITISRVSCLIFLLCFLYHNIRVQKSAALCFDDAKDGIKIITTIRSSHNIESVSQFLEVNEAPCCSSPWKQCTLSHNVQLKFDNITTLLDYLFEPLLFKVRNKCFANGHCRDDIWYHLNNFKQPTVSQSVDITVSIKTSETETKHSGKIHLNSSHPLNVDHRGTLKYIARLVILPPPVDLGPGDPVIPDKKFLLVPEVTSKTDLEHRQIKNGSLEYLVVNQTLFTIPKEKYLMKTNQFLSTGDPKYLEVVSQDMNKQPFDLWIQDRIQQLLGKPTKYFLSSYGTLATNQSKQRKTVSFLMDQDLMVEITILPPNDLFSSDHVQLTTRRGILMTFLGTISDPYRLIDSFCSTLSVSMATCKDSLISILLYLCNILTHLLTVSSEFVGYYDDETIQKEFWKAWNTTTFIIRSGSYNLHVLIVLKILFICVIAIIGWLLFIHKNLPDDLHIQTAVSCPSSADVDHIIEEVLPGVNNEQTNDLHHLGGAELVPSLSETTINSDCSEDGWTSCESSLCQSEYYLSLDEVIPPDEDEIEDDLEEEEKEGEECCSLHSRPSIHDECPSGCSEPIEVISLPDKDSTTIIPEISDAENTDDDDADEEPVPYEIDDEIEKDDLEEEEDECCPLHSRPSIHDECPSGCSEPIEVMSLPDEDSTTIIPEISDAENTDDDADEETVPYEIAKREKTNIKYMRLHMVWASEVCLLKGFYLTPHWPKRQYLVPIKKIKYTDKPRIGTSSPDNESCGLVRLAKSQTINNPLNSPNFGQWIFSAKINPYWVFQNQWPSYTWSTSSYLPVISGTLMRGLPWRDIIYFPGGFVAPCPAVNYRTESLAYLSL